jgi:hypothetical protein
LAGVILSAAKDRAVQAALTAGQRGRTYSIGQRYLSEGVDAPVAGRLLTQDPTALVGGVRPHAYAGNNP